MTEELLLESYLRQLHLPSFLTHYRTLAEDAARSGQDHLAYLLALAEAEVKQREENARRRRIKAARFPLLKELADFDFSLLPGLNRALVLELARGHYISNRQAVILVGNPGTGKTHLAIALGLCACRQGRKVRFWSAAGLAGELLVAQDEHRLGRMIAAALKLEVVVVDEVGFVPFSPVAAQLVFTFFSELYERVSFVLTTNLRFGDWTQVFGDERLTAALLDRLTHHAHILELVGESYRFRQRMGHKERE